jgi:simple sugar transport system permease protein
MDSFVERINFSTASTYVAKSLPFADKLGWFGDIFLSHGLLVYLAIAVAIVTAIILKNTKVGLRLRSVGENPAAADAVGIKVDKYKYLAILIGSGIAGLGGYFYVMDYVQGMYDSYSTVEAFGWLSIALVIFTLWRPNIAVIGSILFAALYVLPDKLNIAVEMNHLKEAIKIVPYIVTVLVLLIISITGGKQTQPPESLGVNYFREER